MRVIRKTLLQIKENPAAREYLPLVVTFLMLSNIKNVIDKHCHILSINEKLQKNFRQKTVPGLW